jgi:cytochrome c oxidase cbb3-type subunit III
MSLSTKNISVAIAGLVFSVAVNAAEKVPAESTASASPFSSVLFNAMLGISILLMLGIVGMAEMVKAGASLRNLRDKKAKQNKDIVKTLALLLMISLGGSLNAQDASVVPAGPPFDYWGMGSTVFYSMLSLIFVQAIIFYVLYRTGISLLRNEEVANAVKQKRSWFFRSAVVRSVTDAVAPEEEEALMMDHEYDGIRELDNNLPAWWKYGFYLTILVAVIYLFHYHVIGTGPSSQEEYANELEAAEQQIAEYKKSTANLVDENTVTRLTDGPSISAGRGIYAANCTPCHGEYGEGKDGLGPNLTDDYWIHEGSTSGIFKSVKYGWTDKGMKSWEQDLKPLEIQQIVSWIQSVRGSNPVNAKAPEGELYVDPADSAAADSLKVDSVLSKPVTDSVIK